MTYVVATASPFVLLLLAFFLVLVGFVAGVMVADRAYRRQVSRLGFGSGVLVRQFERGRSRWL